MTIFCLETGLSSDPAMNWRISALDRFALMSNSDSHSPSRIGREANVFDCALSYQGIVESLRSKDPARFVHTVEFFPQEGKYHYDGHRPCGARISPEESRLNNGRCPNCGKKLTIGVMHRVEDLADRPSGFIPEGSIPFKSSIPLEEIIGSVLQVGSGTATVEREYRKLVPVLGTEFDVLLSVPGEDLRAGRISCGRGGDSQSAGGAGEDLARFRRRVRRSAPFGRSRGDQRPARRTPDEPVLKDC